MATRPSGLSAGGPALALAAIVAGGSVLLFQIGRAAEHDDRRAAFGRETGAVAVAVDRALTSLVATLPTAGRADAELAPSGLAATATTHADARTSAPVVQAAYGPGEDTARLTRLLALPATRVALELTRDTGEAAATDPGPTGRVLLVLARYDGGMRPPTTAERRTRLSGWTVALVYPRAVVQASLAEGGPREVGLRIGDQTVLATSAEGETADVRAQLAHQNWVLTLAPPVPIGRIDGHTWLQLLGGLAAAVATALIGLSLRRRARRDEQLRTQLAREARAISETGMLLQESLELADVVPAVALRLAEDFDLDRLGIALLDDQGDLTELFTYGRHSMLGLARPADLPPVPDALPAGVEIGLPLVRAGRSVGVLRFSARTPLSSVQLGALRAAADLVGAATYNAELYQREQETVRQLKEVDRLKDAFLGTISHELRTPITAIRGFTSLLDDRWDTLADTDRQEFVRRIHRNAASLGQLVDDLLDFARLERQALHLSVEPVPFSAQISNIVEQLSPLLSHHQVVQRVTPDVTAYIDPAAVERILANLLSNAAKFSPRGSTITVEVGYDAGMAMVAVTDEGPGVRAEDRPRVFTRFYRGDGDAARSTRGAGIGLAVVREMVDQMHGDIRIEDREPNGTRMVVLVPTAPVLPAPRETRTPSRSAP